MQYMRVLIQIHRIALDDLLHIDCLTLNVLILSVYM
jgi:hypothetical protein